MDFRILQKIIDKTARANSPRDVFSIAEKVGVKITYGKWFPMTIGEFDKKTKTIFVNQNALVKALNPDALERKIIAHELGHFFANDLNLGKKEEEKFAMEFAAKLLENEV